jgi:hypothetical protein
METMLIWHLAQCLIGKKPISFLKCSEVVKRAGYALIRLFISSNGDPAVEELLNLKHYLFVELVKGSEQTAAKVAEHVEQALLALSLLPSGEWKKAAQVRSIVCGGLWGFRGTVVNWARLQGSHYLPLDESSLHSNDNQSPSSSHHQQSSTANCEDVAPKVPELLDEGDEEESLVATDESAITDNLDDESIDLVNPIPVPHQDQQELLSRISSALDYSSIRESNTRPLVIEE